ncbi:MAG: hypothetical protein JXR13_18665 [Thalassovita sp.]
MDSQQTENERSTWLELNARLSNLEFFLEVLFAQVYGYGPEDAQKESLDSILNVVQHKTKLPKGLSTEEIDFYEDLRTELLMRSEKFAEKIALRANEIRGQLQ